MTSTAPLPPIPASLDFNGRTMLRLQEAADRVGVTIQHLIDLIEEGKLRALDFRGAGSKRGTWRIAIEDYRTYVRSVMTVEMQQHAPAPTQGRKSGAKLTGGVV